MRKTILIAVALMCFALATPISAASDLIAQLKDCARTQDDQQRIACYEQLGKHALAVEPSNTTDTSAVAQEGDANKTKTSELHDSIGGGKYARDAGVPKEQFTGKLKSCKQSVDKRWFYIFENGQVWKQVRHKKIRHKNCDTTASLTKDGFGYIMRIEGEERKVRVKRHR